MEKKIILLGFHLLIILHQSQAVFSLFDCNLDCTKKFLWRPGDTVTWNCTMLLEPGRQNWTVNDITFKKGGSYLADNRTQIVNNSTKQLIIHNATKQEKSFFVYIRQELCQNRIEMKIVDKPSPPDVLILYYVNNDSSSNVTLYTSPSNNETVTGWEIRVGFNGRERDYNYINEYCSGYKEGLPEIKCNISVNATYPCGCPDMSTTSDQSSSSCQLLNGGGSDCFYERRTNKYRFLVTMLTMFGNVTIEKTIAKNFTVTKDIAIAPPVNDLKMNISSRSAEIKWTFWRDLKKEVTFRIRYKMEGSKEFKVRFKENDFVYTIHDLKPYKKYSVIVDCHFRKSPYWSSSQELDFRTLEDAPNISPSISAGSYTYVSSPDGRHTLYLYAKFIPEEDKNGLITYILATVWNITNQIDELQLSPGNETLVITGLTPLSSYDIYLRACTQTNCSHKPSRIYIPAKSQAPLKPVNIVAERQQNGRINVSWTAPDGYNATVHCCIRPRSLSNAAKCLNGYNWHSVDGGERSYQVTLTNQTSVTDLRCGVSVEHDGFSSETAWGDCLYDVQTVPGMVSNPLTHVLQNGATVSWSPSNCQPYSSYPTGYQLSVVTLHKYETNKTDKCSTGSLQDVSYHDSCEVSQEGRSLCRVQLDGWEGSQEYNVCVRARSQTGAGKWWISSSLKLAETHTGAIVAGVIGTVIGIILIILFKRFAYPKFKGREMKFNLPPRPSNYDTAPNGYGTSGYEDMNMEEGNLSSPPTLNGWEPGSNGFMRVPRSPTEVNEPRNIFSNGDIVLSQSNEKSKTEPRHPNGIIVNNTEPIPGIEPQVPNGSVVKNNDPTPGIEPQVSNDSFVKNSDPIPGREPQVSIGSNLMSTEPIVVQEEESEEFEIESDDEDDGYKSNPYRQSKDSEAESVSKEDQKKKFTNKEQLGQNEESSSNHSSVTDYATFSKGDRKSSKSSKSSEQNELQDLSDTFVNTHTKDKKQSMDQVKHVIDHDELVKDHDKLVKDHNKHVKGHNEHVIGHNEHVIGHDEHVIGHDKHVTNMV